MVSGMVELIAVDLDGTLLNSSKSVSYRTQRVIRALCSQGIKVILASARPPRAIAECYKLLGLGTPVVCYNGALIYNPPVREVIFHKPLESRLARSVVNTARSAYRGTVVSVEVLDHWYTDGVSSQYETEVSKQFAPDVLGPIDNWLVQPVTKILLLGPEDRITVIRERILEKHRKRVAMTFSEKNLIQVMSAGVSKGRALKYICNRYGISLQKTMAIGDALNDYDMLEAAGISVAMADAPEQVKQISDYITTGNDEDGVAEAFEKFLI